MGVPVRWRRSKHIQCDVGLRIGACRFCFMFFKF
ncbi:hypothetical protein SOVF_162130 [Spinacia oleracea]|nr:hypothetical protein SOVF_162130 [Spinacia oleracea]